MMHVICLPVAVDEPWQSPDRAEQVASRECTRALGTEVDGIFEPISGDEAQMKCDK